MNSVFQCQHKLVLPADQLLSTGLPSAYGQTTPDNLYASERLSVGGNIR
ncbi:ShlB/FhaC/HecB family hemolysin secretion/activation protein [Klebsiella variicola subsp. variicola]|nr:ShlB/FhaC/HecB family hemolysin secretion/activation protein [Klebsiella variicola subsp. variicola]